MFPPKSPRVGATSLPELPRSFLATFMVGTTVGSCCEGALRFAPENIEGAVAPCYMGSSTPQVGMVSRIGPFWRTLTWFREICVTKAHFHDDRGPA